MNRAIQASPQFFRGSSRLAENVVGFYLGRAAFDWNSQDMGVELDSSLMDESIDLSPDGSRIAFSTSKNSQELWALDNVLAEIKPF